MSSNYTSTLALNHSKVIIDPVILDFFLTFNLMIVGDVIAVLGIVGNVINILNFKAEGFADSYNITLTALAISDIGALVAQMCVNITIVSYWDNIQHPFISMFLLTTGFMYPEAYFIRISGLLTAFGAFERCLCVVSPLKVKSIITRRVTLAYLCAVFAVLFLPLFCINYMAYLDWGFDPKTNRTVISLFYMEEADFYLTLTYLIPDLFLPYLTFLILIVCTIILGFQLKSKADWRRGVTGRRTAEDSAKSKISSEEKKA